MQPLSRARNWGICQQWMHFCSWGTQQREKQLTQGERVLLLYWGWNVDVGSVKGASLVSILTACAHSWHVCCRNMTWNWCVLAETGWEISGSCSLCLFPPSLLMVLNCWRDGSMQLSEESFQPHHQNQLHGPLNPHGGRSWNSREMTLLSAREIVLYIECHSGMGYLQNRDWKNREHKTNFVDTSTSQCSNQGNKKVIQRKIQWPGCLVLYTQSVLVL